MSANRTTTTHTAASPAPHAPGSSSTVSTASSSGSGSSWIDNIRKFVSGVGSPHHHHHHQGASGGNSTSGINASRLDTVEYTEGTELRTVASDEEWLVIERAEEEKEKERTREEKKEKERDHSPPDLFDEDLTPPSSSPNQETMEAGSEAIDGVLGSTKRKATGSSLSPSLGSRSKSVSGARSPRSLRPSSPSNIQRRASGRGPRPLNLEVQQQNGSRHRSGSPSRLRTESPNRSSSSPATKSSLRVKKSSNSGTSSPTMMDTPPPNRAHSQPESSRAAVNGTENGGQKTEDSGSGQAFAAKIRDTLRISRPKRKKDKSKKKGMAYSVDPVKYSAVEITSKYQDPFETSYSENGEEKVGHGHEFQPASIPHNKPEYCDHCGDMAWGLYRQVLKCSSKYMRVCVSVCTH